MEERYVELVEHGVKNRGRISTVSSLGMGRRDYEAYTSVYRFKSDFLDYVKNNIKDGKPSVYGYIGECGASYLWIDIDIEGKLEDATQIMINIVNDIDSKYGISYRSLAIFFSGCKGYHIGIPTKCFDADEYYGDLLPAAFKYMAINITGNSPHVDKKVYNTTRLFRIPYSKHQKSGYYKIPVDFVQIQESGINNMLEYAANGTSHRQYPFEIEFSEKLKKLFEDCIQNAITNVDIFTDNDGYTGAISLKDNSSIFRIPDKGERNDLIYKMAYRLFSTTLKVNEISDIMKFIYEIVNENSQKLRQSRYTEIELRTSINSAYSRTRLRPVTKIKADDFASLTVAIFNQIRNSRYIPTFSDDITEDLKGGWEAGNVYPLIGRGGTMKSFLLQEEIIRSVINNEAAIIFNLEMSVVTLFDRIWHAIFFKSMNDMIMSGEINESNIHLMSDKVKTIVSDNLHIYSQNDIEPDDLVTISQRKQEEIKKKIRLIGVDSVNGMRSYGNEADTAMKISKYTKEAAKAISCPVLLINHANSSCPNTKRDASDHVRGGQKFVDNCDAHISFSKIIDKELSRLERTPPDEVFKRGYIYCRFVNKRGSGNTINKIIQFADNGRIITLPDNPNDFEVDTPNHGFYN